MHLFAFGWIETIQMWISPSVFKAEQARVRIYIQEITGNLRSTSELNDASNVTNELTAPKIAWAHPYAGVYYAWGSHMKNVILVSLANCFLLLNYMSYCDNFCIYIQPLHTNAGWALIMYYILRTPYHASYEPYRWSYRGFSLLPLVSRSTRSRQYLIHSTWISCDSISICVMASSLLVLLAWQVGSYPILCSTTKYPTFTGFFSLVHTFLSRHGADSVAG